MLPEASDRTIQQAMPRRALLRAAGLAGAAIVVPGLARAQAPPPPMGPVHRRPR